MSYRRIDASVVRAHGNITYAHFYIDANPPVPSAAGKIQMIGAVIGLCTGLNSSVLLVVIGPNEWNRPSDGSSRDLSTQASWDCIYSTRICRRNPRVVGLV
ncbi:hypothetical protein GC093_08910 [Paenibacillus sp. LMG 31456]|uniref:Uncharacterized protein n=1 Tax=Paenibacillus foliorum TaxID=2654974 RepID=A0A972JZ84_9BACL|nr:hypothetical protein [Paenibacillus foliorum]NOU93336.1 hypothetical protein [Paenibacillus foliorum]